MKRKTGSCIITFGLSFALACGMAAPLSVSMVAFAAETEGEAVEKAKEEDVEGETEDGLTENSEDSLLATAASLTVDILAGDYERVKTEYSYEPLMLFAVNAGQIEQVMVQSLAASGNLAEQKNAFVSGRQSGYINVDVPLFFTVQSWNLTISFSERGKIAGLHISEYREGMPTVPEGVVETDLALPIDKGRESSGTPAGDEKQELPGAPAGDGEQELPGALAGDGERELPGTLAGDEERELPGTLTMPEGVDSCPAVVFVHGSGVNDRDETLGSIRPFQDLAWGLAQQGIASYRYDKINYVYTEEVIADPDFTLYDETIHDAAAAVELLRSQPGITSVYVVGHSQGAMTMGSIAQLGNPDGCILMAAPARSFTETLERQIQFLKSRSEKLSEQEQKTYDWYEEQIALLKDLDSVPEKATVLGQTLTYMRSLTEYDALAEAHQITVPTLVLQGEEDYQVTMEDFQLWKEQFEGQENWSFQSFPGLTHLFTEGSMEDGPDNYLGERHVSAEVIGAIAEFIRN